MLYEWQLNPTVFSHIIGLWILTPKIDFFFFTTRANKQLAVFVSWKPDPEATSIHKFSFDCSSHKFHCFPPFSLISRCLKKVETEKARIFDCINVDSPGMEASAVETVDKTPSCSSTAEKPVETTQLRESTPPSQENDTDGLLHIRRSYIARGISESVCKFLILMEAWDPEPVRSPYSGMDQLLH